MKFTAPSEQRTPTPAGSAVGHRDGRRTQAKWVENRPPSRFASMRLHELWSYRDLALVLALRDLKVRYKQTMFGVAWAALQPLAGVAIFTLIFGRLVEVPSDGSPYPIFVYVGMLAWVYLATAVNEAAQSLVEKSTLVTKVYFPRIIAPVASVLPGLLDLAISLLILGGFMVFYGVVPGPALLLVPVWLMALVAIVIGMGLWLAALNVQYRDVRHALPFLIQVWLFLSPVVYPSSIVDGTSRYIFAANPLVGVIDGLRWSLLKAPAPGAEALVSVIVGVILVGSGIAYFQRVERRFADIV